MLLIFFLAIGIADCFAGELPKHSRPISYSITIQTGIADNDAEFKGRMVIEFKVLNETSNLILHVKDLLIDERDTFLVDDNSHLHRPEEHQFHHEAETMEILFDLILYPGLYKLELTYTGFLSNKFRGFFKTSYLDDKGVERFLAATQFEPDLARYAFPCWDAPEYRAIFNITLIYERDYQAISNMPIKRETVYGYTKITEFQPTPQMPAYLVAFVVSDFANVTNEFNNHTFWAPKRALTQATVLRDIAIKILRALEDYTGLSYGLPKIDHVSIPNMTEIGMENWGLITYQYSSVLYEDKVTKAEDQYFRTMLVTHELAHQWFGNLVGIDRWLTGWLKEGFAEFLKYYILDKVEPTWGVMKYFVTHVIQILAFGLDGVNATSINETPIDRSVWSDIPYSKAAVVIHMMKCVLTDEIFQQGLRSYLKENAYELTNPDILFESFDRAVKENSDMFEDDFNFKKYMDPWLNQAGSPMIQVDTDVINNIVTITQQRFFTEKPMDAKDSDHLQWYIPLNFATGDKPNFNNTMATKWLKPNETLRLKVNLKNTWIVFNLQHSGYYRVNYNEHNWKLIINQLNKGDHTVIHEINRAQLIADCMHMLVAGKIQTSTLLDLLRYLHKEKHQTPWASLFFNLENLFDVYDPQILSSIMQLILPKLKLYMEFLKYDPQNGDDIMTTRLRPLALPWLCEVGFQSCRNFVTGKLNTWLDNPSEKSIPIELLELVLCYGSALGGPLVRQRLHEQIENPNSAYDKNMMNQTYQTCT